MECATAKINTKEILKFKNELRKIKITIRKFKNEK